MDADPAPVRVAPVTGTSDEARVFSLGAADRSVDELFEFLAREAAVLMRADRSSIFLLDRASGELWSRVALGIGQREIRIPAGRGIVGHVVATGELCNVADPYADPRFNPAVDRETGYHTRSILCAPLRGRDGVIGALQVLNKVDRRPFTLEDERLVSVLAAQCASAIERAQRAGPARLPGEAPSGPSTRSPKLLVAQDGRAVASSVAEVLGADFQVVPVRCGREAISKAQHERPDLFVLDAELDPDGFETCRALRASAAGRGTPIIIISESRRPEDAVHAFEAGADDYLVRPFSPAQLRAKAHTWLLRTSRHDA